MADKTIGELNQASVINNPDLFVLEQNGEAKSLSGETLVHDLLAMIDGHGGILSIVWSESGTSGDGQTHTGTITMTDGTTSTVTFRDGVQGSRGQASYVWIKWASRNPTTNTDMSDTPDAWMGIYSGTADRAPASYTQYKWYETKGLTGDPAQLLSRTVLYQASDSGTTPSGTWQSTVPTVAPGQYLWTHISLSFNGGSVDWYEVARQGQNGVDGLGAVSTVNEIGPDQNNNVALTAADIPYGSSSDVAAKLNALTTDLAVKQATINVTSGSMLKSNGSGTVIAAVKGTDYGSKAFTVTLPAGAASWADDTYEASNTNFVANGYVYTVGPDYSSIDEFTASVIYAENVTTNGKMVFHCKSAPENPIIMNIFRMVSA